MGKPSKVVGNWWHMDFFGLIENQVLADYDVKIFFNFQNFLSWGLALVYSILDHIKLNFYTSNLWSQNVSLFSVLHTPWIFPQKWGRQNMSMKKIYFALWVYTKAGEKEFLKSYIGLLSCHLTSTGRPANLAGINGAV